MVGEEYLRRVLNVKVNWRRKLAALKVHTGIINMDSMSFQEFYVAMLLGQPKKGDREVVRNCDLVRKVFRIYLQALRARCEQLELTEQHLQAEVQQLRLSKQSARGDHLRFLLAKHNIALDERRREDIRELFIRMRVAGVGTPSFNLQLADGESLDIFLVDGDGSRALTYIKEVTGKKHVPVISIK